MANPKGNFGALILRIIIIAVVLAAIAGGFNYLHSHSTLLRETDPEKLTDMNKVLSEGGELKTGEFYALTMRWPVGEFATETSTMNGFTTAKDHYYVVFLEDQTFMAVKLSNADQIADVEKQCEAVIEVLNGDDSLYSVTGGVTVTGKLRKMTASKLTGFYTDFLGFGSDDPRVRMLVLDTGEVSGSKMLIIVGAVALVVIVIVIRSIVRKKAKRREEETMRAESEKAEQTDPYHTA